MADFFLQVNELAHAAEFVGADSTVYTADNSTWPTADGGAFRVSAESVDANVIPASAVLEVVAAADWLDARIVSNNAIVETVLAADFLDAQAIGENAVIENTVASDWLDAQVISVSVPIEPGGYYPPRKPLPIEGIGYGVLPDLVGDAHGVVIAAGIGSATSGTIAGEAAATVGIAGQATAQLALGAAASAGARTTGRGCGALVIRAESRGQNNDDAAVLALLLAA